MLRTTSDLDMAGRDPMRLRELAGLTLEAYRKLNEIAAESNYRATKRSGDDELTRVCELLQEALNELESIAGRSTKSSTVQG